MPTREREKEREREVKRRIWFGRSVSPLFSNLCDTDCLIIHSSHSSGGMSLHTLVHQSNLRYL